MKPSPDLERSLSELTQTIGLVERRPHPTDGRRIPIQLTAQGAAIRQRIKQAKHAWLAQAVAELDPPDQATLFAAGAILKRLAER